MGEAARPGPPISAIIGPARHLAGIARSTAQSLRRLAPNARLIVIREEGYENEIHEVLVAGFDAALAPDATSSELAVALGMPKATAYDQNTHDQDSVASSDQDPSDLSNLELGPAGVPPQDKNDFPDGAHANTDNTDTDNADTPHDAMVDTQLRRQDDDNAAQALAEAAAQDGTTPTQIVAEPTSLGDTDLVEEILRGGDHLHTLSLQVIADQSGIANLELATPKETIPPDHAAATVRYLNQVQGVLHAPAPATSETLEPWAAWLARWLALDGQLDHLRTLSVKDELTGAWNRRYFNRFLARVLQRAAEGRQQVTLMLFDIDDFKHYNDQYGHAAGDAILCEVAKLMHSSVRSHDVVARIGGDEFAVIFWDTCKGTRNPTPDSRHPSDVRNAAARFQKAICEHKFPKLGDQAAGHLSVSGGLAGFPWDGRTAQDLLAFADAMAIRSKQQGKNAITFGPGAEH